MKKKLLFLFSMMALLFAPFTLSAQTDDEYNAALAAITDGGTYRIFTEVESTKYYLNASGRLVDNAKKAATFTFKKVAGEDSEREFGFYVDGGGTRFSNPPGTSESNLKCGYISNSTGERNTWEAQVLFLRDGKYAVRATNVKGGATSGWSWVASSFWTVETVNEEALVAQYDWDPAYIWQIEANVDNRPAAWNKTLTWGETLYAIVGGGVLTKGEEYTSNAKESSEGSYDALCDGVYSTYFHSTWSGAANEDHYLQVELPAAMDEFFVYFKKRHNNNNNRPTNIVISGSNDGSSFTAITAITEGMPTGATPIDYLSDKITATEAYKYLRFTIVDTNNHAVDKSTDGGHKFFTFSEFNILPVNSLLAEAAPLMYSDYTDLDDEDVAKIDAFDAKLTELAQYAAALEKIEDGGNYCISTEVGGVKYFLKADGTLTTEQASAGAFVFTKVAGEEFPYGFKVDAGMRFTNAPGYDDASLKTGKIVTTDGNRDTWEAQVFFMNEEGLFAVRSTNAAYAESGWGLIGSAYWAVNDGPVAEYGKEKSFVWTLEDNSLIEVTYNLVVNGEIAATESIKAPVGFVPTAPASFNEAIAGQTHGLFALKPDVEAITAETTVVNFTPEWGGLFEFSESFAKAKWYNMTIRTNYWVAMDDSEPYYPKSDKDLENLNSYWAFKAVEGEPLQVVIMNAAAGEGKSLSVDGDNVVMRDGECKWDIYSNSNGFVMRPVEGGENDWVNQNGGSSGPLGFWRSTGGRTDDGSTFRVKEAAPIYTITCAEAENGSVVADKILTKAGETVKLTITPAENYELDALTVLAANGEVVSVSRTYTFEMPAFNVSVSATFKEKSDEDSPKNITADYLVNADLATKDYGWTYYSDAYKYQGWETGNENETAAVEFYAGWGSLEHTNFKFSQTITLPAGDYRIAVNAFYREGNDGNGTNADKAWIFAGEKKKNVVAMNSMADLSQWSGSNDMHRAMAAFKSGAFENAFDFSLAEETEIELGFEGKFDQARSWCILGPVQLWQYSLKDYLVAYNEKAIEVEALINSGKKMGATELAALKASIVDESEFTLGSQVVAAIDVMNAAIEAANNSIFGYAQLTAALEKGEDYKAHSVDDEAKSAYDLAINDVKTAYDAATVEDLAAALATVNAALPALAKTQTLAGSDLTVFIVNPEINGAEGWTIDRPVGGNGPLLGGNSFEYWAGNASNRAEASFDYWQEITGLPNGVYTVSADMYNSLNGEGGDYTVFSPTSGVYAASSDSEQARLVDVDGTELITYTTDQVIVLDGTLRIGVKNIMTPMAARWFVADNFKLTLERPLAEGFDSEYEHALAAIRDGANYSITTKVGEDTYYLTPDGKLTADADAAGIFGFKKVAGVQYDFGFLLTSQNDTRFSNPANTEEAALTKGALNTSTNNRTDWEAQVFFMNEEGKFAVRATNAGYNGETSGWAWIGNTYWAVHEGPLAEYSWEKSYDWELVEVNTVKVTYALYDAGSEEPVKNVVVTQKMNSEVVIPTSYTSVAYYDYVAEGTIGTEDCTIKVTRTYKAGLIFSLDDLSNTKAYTIACDRGALLTKDGYMASTAHSSLTSAAASNFAIINYQENYYLYSVVDGKFVTNSGALADVPANGLDDAIKIDPKTAPYFMYYFTIDGTDCGLNTNGNDPYGYVINTWMTADPGNLYYMIEAADFDPTAALTLLEKGAYLVPLREALANNEPNPVLAGEGLFQKPQAAYDAYKQIYDAQKLVAENEASTIAELIDAKAALDDAIADYAAVEVNKPAAGQLYMFQHKSSGGYMGFNDQANLFVLDDPDAFTWSEVEGGYNLNNGAFFIAVDGSTLLGNAEAGVLITATPVATSEDGQIYYNIITTTTDGKVRAITGSTANKKATLITTPTEKSQWTIVPYEVKTTLDLAINVDRYPGMGYTVTEASVDFTEAKKFLGVEELTTSMLSIINPDETEITDYATYDGWFNAEGVATTWGETTAINVKFFQAIPDGKFTICDMNGADEIGKAYTVKWALTANEKKAIFTITVTFVEKPAPVITNISEVTIAETKNVEVKSELGKCYEGMTADVDVAAILTKLGAASLDDLLGIYAVASNGALDDNYKLGTTDGWRNADGDWQGWGDDAYFYVKANFALESAQLYEIGGMQGKNTAEEWQNPASYTATYVFVNKDLQAVVLKVTLKYEVPVGIRDMQLDGKAEIYDLNGRKVSKIQRGGIYIVNGKRVAVK